MTHSETVWLINRPGKHPAAAAAVGMQHAQLLELSLTRRAAVAAVCRHLVRSVQFDKASGLISLTSRVPPKLLRDCMRCTKCGGDAQEDLGLLVGAAEGPDWELCLDPTAPNSRMAQRMCMGCITGEALVQLCSVEGLLMAAFVRIEF